MKFSPIPQNLEYHRSVNRSASRPIPPLPALLGAFALPLLLVALSSAQLNSANSGSAHAVSVAPPTAAVSPRTAAIAAPTRGIAPPTGSTFTNNIYLPPTSTTHNPHPPHAPSGTQSSWHPKPQQNANGGAYYYPYVYAVPVPYGVDLAATDASGDNQQEDDADDQGGPTIFDRHGSGPDSYIAPADPGPAHAQDQDSDASSAANQSPQPATTLVFKDGHAIEVENYAIVSQTLYDLTLGHPRRIALADLDFEATQKQNDDRGVLFQLPPQPQAN